MPIFLDHQQDSGQKQSEKTNIYSKDRKNGAITPFKDKRPKAIAQTKLQSSADHSPAVKQLKSFVQKEQKRNIKSNIPIQMVRARGERETLENYANYIIGVAQTVMNEDARIAEEGGDVERTNTLYLLSCQNDLRKAKSSGFYIEAAIDAVTKAIDEPAYSGEFEKSSYDISQLEGYEGLDEGDISKIEERIEAMNSGEGRFNLHIGVGGVPTMDVTGTSFGGSGRGNVRLQFLGGSLRLVNHANKSLL